MRTETLAMALVVGVGIMLSRTARSRKPDKDENSDWDPMKKDPLPLPGESIGPDSLRNCKDEKSCPDSVIKVIRDNPEFDKGLFIKGASNVGTFSEYTSFLKDWANMHPNTLILFYYDKDNDFAGSFVSGSKAKKIGEVSSKGSLHKNFKELEEDLIKAFSE